MQKIEEAIGDGPIFFCAAEAINLFTGKIFRQHPRKKPAHLRLTYTTNSTVYVVDNRVSLSPQVNGGDNKVFIGCVSVRALTVAVFNGF